VSHTCHATGCTTPVPPALWGCARHWRMVPVAIRRAIWTFYRSGQESDWQPSKEYLRAARAAVIAVAEREGIAPDTSLYDAFLKHAPK